MEEFKSELILFLFSFGKRSYSTNQNNKLTPAGAMKLRDH